MDVTEKSKELKKEKERLIRSWIELRDRMDTLNESMFLLTRDIEILNVRIEKTLVVERKKSVKKTPANPPRNGTS